jgi:hypothetical protein
MGIGARVNGRSGKGKEFVEDVINGLIIIKTLICKIPPNLPLLKGGITSL